MSDEIERLLVRVEANAKQFETQMRKINKSIYGSQAETRKTLNAINRDTKSMSRTMFQPVGDAFRKEIAGLSGILAGLFTTQQVARYADAYTGLQNRLKAAGLEGAALVRVEDALYAAANRNGVEVDAVAQLYQRAALSKKALGATDQQIIALTDGVTAALRVQGVSAQQASGPLLQLGQALGGGVVRAEELNSLLEGTPIILQAAAAGSAKYAGDVNALSVAIRDGKVTSQEFFAALLKGLPEIEKKAADLPKTIGQALQSLDNAFGRYIGQTDASLSASQRAAQGIQALADNLDTIVPIVTTLAALIGGAYVLSLTKAASAQLAAGVSAARLALFQTAMTASMTGTSRAALVAAASTRTLNAAMAANPIGLVVTVVAALAAGLFLLSRKASELETISSQVEAQEQKTSDAMREYEAAAIAAATATGEARKSAIELLKTKRELAIREVDAALKARDTAVAYALQRAELAKLAAQEATRQRARDPGEVGGSLAFAAAQQQAAAEAKRIEEEAIASAKKAQEDADSLRRRIADGSILGGGGGGGGGSGGGGSDSDAKRIADLRTRLELEEQMAAARATGDAKAIAAEEERQRLIELTERYRAAGYADAASRAMQLLAAENQAKDVEESRERLAERRKEHAEWEANLRRRALDWTQRQYDQELDLARIQGDPAVIRKLEREAELRQRIAEYVERFGMAGYGLAVSEQMQVDGARDSRDADERLTDNARTAARHFVDVLAADSWAEAAGHKFKQAAFDGLEDLFTTLFKQMGSGDGGGFFGSIAKGIGTFFGGGRASGGPVTAGRAYRINENTAKSEIFVPGVSGRIVTDAQAASGQGANRVRGGVVEHRVIVVPDQDSFIRLAGDVAQPMADMARAGAFGDVASASAASQRRAALRTRRR